LLPQTARRDADVEAAGLALAPSKDTPRCWLAAHLDPSLTAFESGQIGPWSQDAPYSARIGVRSKGDDKPHFIEELVVLARKVIGSLRNEHYRSTF